MSSSALVRLALVALLGSALATPVGCAQAERDAGPRPKASAEATVSSPTTVPAEPATTPAEAPGIDDSEAAALEKELSAIESELGSLSLPDDSDFSGITP